MSNVSIYAKSWIDLVFEGKNKAYGAYQLRQENSKTSAIALIGGVTFFLTVIGGGLFLSSFGDAAPIAPDNTDIVIKVDNIISPPERNEEPKSEIIPPVEKEPEQEIKSEDLVDPVIAKTNQATDIITKNEDLGKTKTDDPNPNGGDSKGTVTPVNTGGGGDNPDGKGDGKKDGDGPIPTGRLDKLPEYPGGINKFYEYVSRNFDRPEIDEDGNVVMSVIVSFVVEKNGTLTDIKVLRSSDSRMEKEAIRVLRALRVKWTPGIKDGEPVRTLYTLPIKVKI